MKQSNRATALKHNQILEHLPLPLLVTPLETETVQTAALPSAALGPRPVTGGGRCCCAPCVPPGRCATPSTCGPCLSRLRWPSGHLGRGGGSLGSVPGCCGWALGRPCGGGGRAPHGHFMCSALQVRYMRGQSRPDTLRESCVACD